MSDIKTKVQGLDPNIQARDVQELVDHGKGNIYQGLVAISKRSNQLSVDIKHELHQKLDEFAVSSDAIEEISENKEQIEISKFYERLPNPVIIALNEFLTDELYFRNNDRKNRRNR